MEAGEAAAGCGRRVGAGFCQILPGCSCSSSAAQETQSFVSSSAIFRWQLFLLLFLRADPEPQGWADFLPFPSCSDSSTASCGVSNLPRNIFAVANHLFSGIYPNM